MKAETYLMHHGIKGMKWGVRRDRSYSGGGGRRSSSRKAKTSKFKTSSKSNQTRSVKKMSDAELKRRIERLELERKYANLSGANVKSGKDYVGEFLAKNSSAFVGAAVGAAGGAVGKIAIEAAKKKFAG